MKDIPGYEGLYAATKDGKIWSYSAKRYLRGGLSGGYRTVTIHNKTRGVARLVAFTFLFRAEGLNVVNHINGIKTDNRVENLEWCTFQRNNQHAYDAGLHKKYKGSKHSQAKLTEENVLDIRRYVKEGILSRKEIAARFKIVTSHIAHIIKRDTWKHI